jgi:hypothetical protein
MVWVATPRIAEQRHRVASPCLWISYPLTGAAAHAAAVVKAFATLGKPVLVGETFIWSGVTRHRTGSCAP